MPKKAKEEKPRFKKSFSNGLLILMWGIGLTPFLAILFLRYVEVNTANLPSITMLENQNREDMLATAVFADDGKTVLGKYWRVNRTSVPYNKISPYVISALISTEDERFKTHSGIDLQADGRAIMSLGTAGGASTITQQLAKLIFTLKQREEREKAQKLGKGLTDEEKRLENMNSVERRLYEKVKENVIALRLERRYAKNEIITMYLNQFDFLYNAVGISSAARVYFNKEADSLAPDEAAILVGMCKNPSLFNPYTYTIRDYRSRIARWKGIPEEKVALSTIQKERKEDSLLMINRRNTVLYKWYENSLEDNPALLYKLSKKEYDSLRKLPLHVDYNTVDHRVGLAPYYMAYLRNKIPNILEKKLPNGEYMYHKPNGEPYNIYEDGLTIYTTIDVRLQKHAREAMTKHLKTNLQPAFTKNNRKYETFPFAYDVSDEVIKGIMKRTRRRSSRWYNMRTNGVSKEKIIASFDQPVPMTLFSWNGEIDTVMTPNDSIRYYKNIIRAGLVSIEPQTGFIKAWIGGPNFKYFPYDHVYLAKRQVGSTIKPFIYSAGMQFGVITPCETTPNIPYCVDVQTGPRPEDKDQWCPHNAGEEMNGEPITFAEGLAKSMNNITVAVMARMGGTAGPQAVAKLMKDLNIDLKKRDIVPSMCLGVMDLSLLHLIGAQATFANGGIYNKPSSIIRIADRHGNTIYQHQPVSREVMSADLAYTTIKMMEGVVLHGTGSSLRGTWRDWGGITYPTAGKTGTTQNNTDGWFVGITPDLATGVWVGAEDMAVRFRTMRWGQGARMALPIYGYMMQEVYKDAKIHISTEDFKRPYGYENSIYNCKRKPKEKEKDSENPFGI